MSGCLDSRPPDLPPLILCHIKPSHRVPQAEGSPRKTSLGFIELPTQCSDRPAAVGAGLRVQGDVPFAVAQFEVARRLHRRDGQLAARCRHCRRRTPRRCRRICPRCTLSPWVHTEPSLHAEPSPTLARTQPVAVTQPGAAASCAWTTLPPPVGAARTRTGTPAIGRPRRASETAV